MIIPSFHDLEALTALAVGIPILPLVLGGASLLSGLFKDKSRQTGTSRPTLDPAFGPLQQGIIDRITARLSAGSSLPAGYEEQGIRDINRSYKAGQLALENDLTARGLSSSPVASRPLADIAGRRTGEIARFRTNLPLIERDLANQDLSLASSILDLGRGTEFTGDFGSGGGIGGGLGDLATMLGYFYGQGLFGNGGGGGGGGVGTGTVRLPGSPESLFPVPRLPSPGTIYTLPAPFATR